MPLVRLQVRNEFGLGDPELYKTANRDDPKAILDGVAVAGLVGILRQLGDLAEFAAEVFHDLHEQMTATAARSHKMTIRVQRIEAVLPPLEKAVLTQTSHLHFAYTAGSDWHPEIFTEQNHLSHSDLPQFIMDCYEECRDPPRFFLLDKFDAAGAGSCLKRYTDPSFFKTVWASSELMKAEKVQRERKPHKIKKTGSQKRNGEVSHAAFISRPHSRLQFAFSDTDGRSPMMDAVSPSHMSPKSELGNQSTSFDSGSRSGYIECVVYANSSIEPQELEGSGFPTSKIKMEHGDIHVPSLLDEQNGKGAESDTPQGSVQGQIAPRSSVTWDEKTEILNPSSQLCDSTVAVQGQSPESPPVNSSNLEPEASNLRNVDQEDIMFDVENIPESSSGINQFDEVTSETDNYMDALNTMESEVETDSECQTKHEVELHSNFRHQELEPGTDPVQMAGKILDDSSEGPYLAPCSSPNKEVYVDLHNSVISECSADEEPSQLTELVSNTEASINTGFPESPDAVDVARVDGLESVKGDPSSGSGVLGSEGSNRCKSQESPGTADIPSVRFWTNGNLLGLQPLKPPDFSPQNVASQNPSPGVENSNHNLSGNISNSKLLHDESAGKSDAFVSPIKDIKQKSGSVEDKDGPSTIVSTNTNQLVQSTDNAHHSTSFHKKQNGDMSVKHNLQESDPTISRMKPEEFQDSYPRSIFSHIHGHDSAETDTTTPRSELPMFSDNGIQSNESSRNNIKTASSISVLNDKFLENGAQRESLPAQNVFKPSTMKNNDPRRLQERPQRVEQEHIGMQSRISDEPTPNVQLGLDSPKNSISSKSSYTDSFSPPLRHMKISFHPIDSLETSKLKLQFPDGHHFHESMHDVIFPSFQLLPEPVIPVQDIGSESDDDTFCKSSPYLSDDALSPRSMSNSEQWESSGTTGSKDQDIYEALCRVSSSASISSPLDLDGVNHHEAHPVCEFGSSNTENGIRSFNFGPSLPSLGNVNSVIQQEGNDDSEAKDRLDPLQCCDDLPLPPPPPLPPLQWRITKDPFSSVEDKQSTFSKAGNQPNDLHILGSITSQQPKAASPKQPHFEGPVAYADKNLHKVNGHKKDSQPVKVKESNEREDLLDQIRNKSFSLRRTVPARPNLSPGPTTNINVAAILEKANAIRQAFVGSDDGGDDENWSDG